MDKGIAMYKIVRMSLIFAAPLMLSAFVTVNEIKVSDWIVCSGGTVEHVSVEYKGSLPFAEHFIDKVLISVNLSGMKLLDYKKFQETDSLQYLDLTDTDIKDLSVISRNLGLKELGLSGTAVKDLKPLAGMNKMKTLDLSYTEVKDISSLKEMISLEHLSLTGTKVKKLDSLRELKKLNYLDLSGTEISSVKVLTNLKNLRHLDLTGTNVAVEEVEELSSINKNLVILK